MLLTDLYLSNRNKPTYEDSARDFSTHRKLRLQVVLLGLELGSPFLDASKGALLSLQAREELLLFFQELGVQRFHFLACFFLTFEIFLSFLYFLFEFLEKSMTLAAIAGLGPSALRAQRTSMSTSMATVSITSGAATDSIGSRSRSH